MIIIFRGIAASGKTKTANELKKVIGFDILSKDILFDNLLLQDISWDEANHKTYEILKETINEYSVSKKGLIVDVGLAHVPYFEEFIKDIVNKECILSFLFICSDMNTWENRILDRIKNIQGPNQNFKSPLEAKLYYEKCTIYPLDGEIIIDSVDKIEKIIEKVVDKVELFRRCLFKQLNR
jgi:hypothetical protein